MADDKPFFTDPPDFTDPPEPEKARPQAPAPAPAPAPEPEPAADDFPDDGKVRIRLSKPLTVAGKGGMVQRDVLEFRAPTGADLVQVGNPTIFDITASPPRLDHDVPKMLRMMWLLSGVPVVFLEKMEPQDMIGAFWKLTPFFMPRTGIT